PSYIKCQVCLPSNSSAKASSPWGVCRLRALGDWPDPTSPVAQRSRQAPPSKPINNVGREISPMSSPKFFGKEEVEGKTVIETNGNRLGKAKAVAFSLEGATVLFVE